MTKSGRSARHPTRGKALLQSLEEQHQRISPSLVVGPAGDPIARFRVGIGYQELGFESHQSANHGRTHCAFKSGHAMTSRMQRNALQRLAQIDDSFPRDPACVICGHIGKVAVTTDRVSRPLV
jgi:hypothetical protein